MLNNLGRHIVKVHHLWRHAGFPAVLRRSAQRLWHSNTYIVYSKQLTACDAPDTGSGVVFRIATRADIPWIAENMLHLGNRASPLLEEQFGEADRTVIGHSASQPKVLLYSAWLSCTDKALQLLGCPPNVSDVSIRRIWVPEEHRRRGLAKYGTLFAENVATNNGVERLWSFVQVNNAASIRLHDNLGYCNVGRIQLIRICAFAFAWVRHRGQHICRFVRIPRAWTKL